QIGELCDMVGNLVVVVPVRVLRPGIELPVRDSFLTALVFHEYRAGVAQPDAVRAPAVEVHAGEVGSSALKDCGGAAFSSSVVDEDVYVFHAREVAHDLCVDPGDWLELSWPVLGVVRPGDPGGGVGFPLGGHAITCGGHSAAKRSCLRGIRLQGIAAAKGCRRSRRGWWC